MEIEPTLHDIAESTHEEEDDDCIDPDDNDKSTQKPFKCKICGAGFGYETIFKNHVDLHGAWGKHICSKFIVLIIAQFQVLMAIVCINVLAVDFFLRQRVKWRSIETTNIWMKLNAFCAIKSTRRAPKRQNICKECTSRRYDRSNTNVQNAVIFVRHFTNWSVSLRMNDILLQILKFYAKISLICTLPIIASAFCSSNANYAALHSARSKNGRRTETHTMNVRAKYAIKSIQLSFNWFRIKKCTKKNCLNANTATNHFYCMSPIWNTCRPTQASNHSSAHRAINDSCVVPNETRTRDATANVTRE